MRITFVWFLILVLLIIVQTTLFPFPFFFPLLLALTVFSAPKDGFWLAFGTGLVLDLFAGTPLGRSSLALLLIAGLVNAYKRRYFTTHPAYTFFLALISVLVFDFLTGRPFSLLTSLVVAFLALPAGFLVRRFSQDDEVRLRL